ncbi:hypothetical protein [Nesterenkonia muleiensis]|uniref:hypothetical protein n=1 Tax=Nesterenkonia muleiensis TaxID=2282648 RepID=UPI001300A2D9|nr:hypothetical protein [Nesterenkonia muleiensis]
MSDDPLRRAYTIVQKDNGLLRTLLLDEHRLLARVSGTSTLREPRTPEYLRRCRRLMDDEAELWVLEWLKERDDWYEQPYEERKSLRLIFKDAANTPLKD